VSNMSAIPRELLMIDVPFEPKRKPVNQAALKRSACTIGEISKLIAKRLVNIPCPADPLAAIAIIGRLREEIMNDRYEAECALDTEPIDLEISALKNVRIKVE
jgi:hypothetical protein